MKKSRFSDAQIVGVLQEPERGAKVPDLCRKHGITEPTFAPLLPLVITSFLLRAAHNQFGNRWRIIAMNTEPVQSTRAWATSQERDIFSSSTDYDAFEAMLARDPEFEQIPVRVPYYNLGIAERWYRCRRCGDVWRLVEPDPPFTGLWKLVPASQLA